MVYSPPTRTGYTPGTRPDANAPNGTADPLVDLRLFRNRLFSAATSLYGLGSVAYLGALFMAALFLQNGLGLSALQSGLITFPTALGGHGWRPGRASSVFNAAKQLGGAIGVALLAVAAAVTVRDADAAATMVPRRRQHPAKHDKDPVPAAQAG